MEALTRQWRDSYRSPEVHETMTQLPTFATLPPLFAPLDRSVLTDVELLPKLKPLPSLDEGSVDFLRDFIARDRSETLESASTDEAAEEHDAESGDDDLSKPLQRPSAEDDPTNAYDYFDNVLDEVHGESQNKVLATRSASDCLQHLLHGRESRLFRWNGAKLSFEVVDASLRLSGTTRDATGALFASTARQGSLLRRLRAFCDQCRAQAREGPRSRIVLSTFIEQVLEVRTRALDRQCMGGDVSSFGSIDRASGESAVYLDWLVELLQLDELSSIAEAVHAYSGKHILDTLWQQLQRSEAQVDTVRWLRLILLQRLMQNVLADLSAKLSMRSSAAPPEFVASKRNVHGDHVIDGKTCPGFIPVYARELLVECEQNAALVWAAKRTAATDNELRFHFVISSALGEFDHQARPEQRESVIARSSPLDRSDKAAMQQSLLKSLQTMQLEPIPSKLDLEDEITALAGAPLVSLTIALRDGLIAPLAAHAERLRNVALEIVFDDSKLRDHLELLQQVYFFDNGKMVVQLTEKLFTTRSNKVGRGTAGNISVNSPDALRRWPPLASSVGVALRNVMTDTITDSRFYADDESSRQSEPQLLGHIGFRIDEQDLDQAEEQPHPAHKARSLDALSFLRFRYQPPPALQAVIGSTALRRIDQISQFLLILLRCHEAVQRMSREHAMRSPPHAECSGSGKDRMRFEMAHFVRAVTAHALDTAVGARWQRLMAELDTLSTTRRTASIKAIRQLIDATVEQMTAACLLNRRAAEVAQLLRTCLQLVLDCSHLSSQTGGSASLEDEEMKLYDSFDRNARKVVRVCEAAVASSNHVDRRRASTGTRDAVEHPLTGLAVRLQLNGFWS